MRMMTFAKRNFKEIVRDPLNLAFLFGFPAVLLLLLTAIQKNVPVSLFEIESLSPGAAVFGLAFMTLFSATLIAKDRQSSFMQRLYTTPMRPVDFILGYTLPLVPIAVTEGIVAFAVSVLLGLRPSLNTLAALVFLIPTALLYIGIGLLCGSVFNDKQVGGICGALLTNVSAWLSGIWFDLQLVGGAFEKAARLLPFLHSVEMERAVVDGRYADALSHMWWVLGYAAVILIFAVFLFLRQMKRQ